MHSLILKWEKAEKEKVLAGYTCLQIIEGLWQESTIRIVIFYSILHEAFLDIWILSFCVLIQPYATPFLLILLESKDHPCRAHCLLGLLPDPQFQQIGPIGAAQYVSIERVSLVLTYSEYCKLLKICIFNFQFEHRLLNHQFVNTKHKCHTQCIFNNGLKWMNNSAFEWMNHCNGDTSLKLISILPFFKFLEGKDCLICLCFTYGT